MSCSVLGSHVGPTSSGDDACNDIDTSTKHHSQYDDSSLTPFLVVVVVLVKGRFCQHSLLEGWILVRLDACCSTMEGCGFCFLSFSALCSFSWLLSCCWLFRQPTTRSFHFCGFFSLFGLIISKFSTITHCFPPVY